MGLAAGDKKGGDGVQKRRIGIALSYGKVAVNLLCGLALSAVLLRALGDAQYGVYQTVAAFANCLVLLEFGMGTVMLRNLSVCRASGGGVTQMQRQVSTLWTLSLILCGGILALGAALYGLVPKVYALSMTEQQVADGQKMFAVLSVHVALSFLRQTVDGVLLATEHYRYSAVEGMARTLARTVLILAGVLWIQDAMVIVWVDLVCSGSCLVASMCYCRKKTGLYLRPGMVDRAVLGGILPLAMAIFLQALVGQAYNNVDKFLIGVMIGPETVAMYGIALYVFGVFSALTTVPVMLYGPQLQACAQQGGDLQRALQEPCRLTAMMGGAVLAGFVAVGRPFVRLFYGEAYLDAWMIGLVLMTPAYLDAVISPALNGLDAKNRRMGRSVILLAATLANVSLTVVWLRIWGPFGAACATAVSTLAGQVALGNWYYRKVLGINVLRLYEAAFRDVWLWLIFGGAAGAMVAWLLPNAWAALLLGGAVCVGCMLPMLRSRKR